MTPDEPTPWDLPASTGPPVPPVPSADPWAQQLPYGQQPYYGQQPWSGPPSQPASTSSVVALVTGILGLIPVAVVAGIMGIRRANRGAGGRGLAIAGLAVAGGWTLLLAGGIALAVFASSSPDGGGALGRLGDAGSSSIGACLMIPDPKGQSVSTVTDCLSSHQGEVYSTQHLDGDTWPGYDTVYQRADDNCYDEYDPYVGKAYEDSSFDYGFYAPDEAEWNEGKRTVVCVVVFPDRPTVGSVQGSGS